jgi:hypothetical protein
MAAITWAESVSGDFANAAYWTGGDVPGSSDDAILDGTGYTVTSSTDVSLNSLQVAAGATISCTGHLTLANGTGTGVNAGDIVIKNFEERTGGLTVDGTLSGSGTVDLFFYGDLATDAAGLTLDGGGKIKLHDGGAITSGAAVITNVSDTIVGPGFLGGFEFNNQAAGVVLCQAPAYGSLNYAFHFSLSTLNNAGLIRSTLNGGVYFNVANAMNNSGIIDNLADLMAFDPVSLTNTGLIEATASGTVLFNTDTVNGSGGGVILAGSGDQVQLHSTTIIGGTLKGAGTFVTTDSGSLLDGSASPVTNLGHVSVAAGDTLGAAGVIANSGTVSLGAKAVLEIAAAGATFSGAGRITLDPGGTSTIAAAGGAAELDYANAIVGAGLIGPGVTLVGLASGLINANSTYALTLSGDDLVGGTLKTTGYGLIHLKSGLLDGTGAAVTNLGTVTVNSGLTETAQGVLSNSGQVDLNGTARLVVGAPGLTLTGRGKVLMSAAGEAAISGSTLTNAGNVIFGAGDIGGGAMSLINAAGATIKATDATPLILDTGANTIVNTGTIEAVAGGIGEVMSAVNNGGWLYANGGSLTVEGAVTGTGKALIKSGTLTFTSAFNQIVSFIGTSGRVVLAQSQAFTNFVRGFSKTGGTSLDLQDIAFGGATSASYSGTTASGVLTVSDGTHTAHIHLQGDYTGSTFTLSSDGSGGTLVVDPPAEAAPRAAAPLTQALAGFGARSAGGARLWDSPPRRPYASLARPA